MKLHIGNLPKTLTEPELTNLITPFAQPTSVEIVKDSAGTSRGYAFVVVADDAQGKALTTGLDGTATSAPFTALKASGKPLVSSPSTLQPFT